MLSIATNKWRIGYFKTEDGTIDNACLWKLDSFKKKDILSW
jgi:hypothetical protein